MKKVVRQRDFSTRKTLSAIFLTQVAKNMSHSRAREIEADSLGFLYMAKAGFNPISGQQTMDVLKKSETPLVLLSDTLDMKSFFDLEGVNFDEEWLDRSFIQGEWKSQEGLFEIPDSLRSHPDTDFRKKLLGTGLEAELSDEVAELNKRYSSLKQLIDCELIEVDLENESFDIALFRALHLLKAHPDDPYLCSVVTWCLFHFKYSIMDNTFSSFVEMPSEHFTMSFNAYLCFLHNQNSRSLDRLLKAFYAAQKDVIDDLWLGGFLTMIFSYANEENGEWRSLKDQYNRLTNHFASKQYIKTYLN